MWVLSPQTAAGQEGKTIDPVALRAFCIHAVGVTLACGELAAVRMGAQDVSHAAPDLEHMAEATCAPRLPASGSGGGGW